MTVTAMVATTITVVVAAAQAHAISGETILRGLDPRLGSPLPLLLTEQTHLFSGITLIS